MPFFVSPLYSPKRTNRRSSRDVRFLPQADSCTYAAPGPPSGSGPNLFGPRVPSKHQKTISTMMPIRGMKLSSHHQPLRSVSCNLRTPIASDGRSVTKPQIDENGVTLLDNTSRSNTSRSMIDVTMLTRTVNRVQYQNSDRDARLEKPT